MTWAKHQTVLLTKDITFANGTTLPRGTKATIDTVMPSMLGVRVREADHIFTVFAVNFDDVEVAPSDRPWHNPNATQEGDPNP